MKSFLLYTKIIISYRLSRVGTGITKHSLVIGDDQNTIFSYYEKGSKVLGQTTFIFIHGFSSTKESWLSLIKVSIYSQLQIDTFFFYNFIENSLWIPLYHT